MEWPDLTAVEQALLEYEATRSDAALRRMQEAFADATSDRNARDTALRIGPNGAREFVDRWHRWLQGSKKGDQ